MKYVPPASGLESSPEVEYSDYEDVIPMEEVTTLREEGSAPLQPSPGYISIWAHEGTVKDGIVWAGKEYPVTEMSRNLDKELNSVPNEIDAASQDAVKVETNKPFLEIEKTGTKTPPKGQGQGQVKPTDPVNCRQAHRPSKVPQALISTKLLPGWAGTLEEN